MFIGIPTINRGDLLQELLEDLTNNFDDPIIHIVDNGNQNIVNSSRISQYTTVHHMPYNLGVAGSWNFLLHRAFRIYKKEWALLLNDDIIFGKTPEDINNIISSNRGSLITGSEFATILIKRFAFESIGQFDEKFYPAYFEDNDYCYRADLSGINRCIDRNLNPEVFRQSKSIEKDPSLNDNFDQNKKYYIKKWGGKPLEEQYTRPFNI